MASSYPGTLDSFTDPAGTNTLAEVDHASQHVDTNDAIEKIESVLGTTAGTSVLSDFNAGDVALRTNSGGTLAQTITKGTANNLVMGSPAVTGGTLTTPTINNPTMGSLTLTSGTLNNVVIGTPTITGGALNNGAVGTSQITGGTLNNAVIGTPAITGGTATLNTINANGDNAIVITPGTSKHLKTQMNFTQGASSSYIPNFVTQGGWGYFTGNGAINLEGSISFAQSFGTLLGIVITAIGYKAGTTPPTSITQFDNNMGNMSAIYSAGYKSAGTTGFNPNIRCETGATFSTANCYGYSWLAFGVI